LMLVFLATSCRGPVESLPVVHPPARVLRPAPQSLSKILTRELSTREVTFVVLTTEAPRTTASTLLEIADYLAQDSKEFDRTLVLFRNPEQPHPASKLSRSEEWAHSFAFAVIDPVAHIRETERGLFN
jgi:hypothetical protein